MLSKNVPANSMSTRTSSLHNQRKLCVKIFGIKSASQRDLDGGSLTHSSLANRLLPVLNLQTRLILWIGKKTRSFANQPARTKISSGLALRRPRMVRPWRGPLPKPRSPAPVTLATFMPPELVTNPDRVAEDTASCMAVNSIAKQSQDLRVLVERAKSFGRSRGDLVRSCPWRTHVRVTPIDKNTKCQ